MWGQGGCSSWANSRRLEQPGRHGPAKLSIGRPAELWRRIAQLARGPNTRWKQPGADGHPQPSHPALNSRLSGLKTNMWLTNVLDVDALEALAEDVAQEHANVLQAAGQGGLGRLS